jgi:hypothetical protein
MAILSIPKRKVNAADEANASMTDSRDWVDFVAGGSLLAGALLLLTRQRRAGLVLSVTGTALTLLNQQQTVRDWWDQFPGYVDRVQNMIGRVQSSMDELSVTRENLNQALTGTDK